MASRRNYPIPVKQISESTPPIGGAFDLFKSDPISPSAENGFTYKFECPSDPHIGGTHDTCIVLQVLAARPFDDIGVQVVGREVVVSTNIQLTQAEINKLEAAARAHRGDQCKRSHESQEAVLRANMQGAADFMRATTEDKITALLAREQLSRLHWEEVK